MKLKCVEHNRRVMVINPLTALHRNDGTTCESYLKIGVFIGSPSDVFLYGTSDKWRPISWDGIDYMK